MSLSDKTREDVGRNNCSLRLTSGESVAGRKGCQATYMRSDEDSVRSANIPDPVCSTEVGFEQSCYGGHQCPLRCRQKERLPTCQPGLLPSLRHRGECMSLFRELPARRRNLLRIALAPLAPSSMQSNSSLVVLR